jgi:hypothetical protein
MNRRVSIRMLAATLCVVAGAGCSANATVPTAAGVTGKVVTLTRGQTPDGTGWSLTAQELRSTLCLTLEGPTGAVVSTACGFSAAPSAGFEVFGAGPGHVLFIYGPVPSKAVQVRLSASGYRTFVVPTTALPREAHLPRGRFYVAITPGPATLGGPLWRPVALDAAGRHIPFTNF